MKKKFKLLLDNIFVSLIGIILINIFSIVVYLGISGLLYNNGQELLNVYYIKISFIIISISSFIFTFLYIVLFKLKNKDITSMLSVVGAILFVLTVSNSYLVYMEEISGALLNGTYLMDSVIKMGVYLLIGIFNLFIFTYSSIISLLIKIFNKIHK